MPVKVINFEDIGDVKFVKSARSKTFRLSIGADGGVRVSLPTWATYFAAKQFVLGQKGWVMEQLSKNKRPFYEDGQRIGKMHLINFHRGTKARTRLGSTTIEVYMAPGEQIYETSVQNRAQVAIKRALRRESELLIPPRVAALAAEHGFSYGSISIKNLKRRWGSCDSYKNLVFNMYLADLPTIYIDYVICHELVHTVHMNHNAAFWGHLERIYPGAKRVRIEMRKYQPVA